MKYFEVKISIDGQPLESMGLGSNLVSIETRQDELMCDMVTIDLWNQGKAFTDSNIFRDRALIDVTISDGGTFAFIDRYRLEKPQFRLTDKQIPIVRLIAFNDAITLKELGEKRKAFYNQTDSEIVAIIASENGLLFDIQSTNTRRTQENQLNETDLSFLTRLAKRNGYLFYIEQGTLHFHELRFDDSFLEINFGDEANELIYFEPSKVLVGKGSIFVSSIMDKLNGTMLTARSADVPDAVFSQDIAKYPSYRDPKQIFTQRPTKYITGLESANDIMSHQNLVNRAQQHDSYFVGGYGKSTGLPSLRARKIVKITGVGHVSGLYYFTSVTHRVDVDGEGFVTKFYAMKSRIGLLQQTNNPGSQSPSTANSPANEIQPEVVGEASLS